MCGYCFLVLSIITFIHQNWNGLIHVFVDKIRKWNLLIGVVGPIKLFSQFKCLCYTRTVFWISFFLERKKILFFGAKTIPIMTVMVSRISLWNLINIYSEFFFFLFFYVFFCRCRRRRFIDNSFFFLLNACVTLRDKIIIMKEKKTGYRSKFRLRKANEKNIVEKKKGRSLVCWC